MVIGPIIAGIKIAQKIYKYRNQIYAVASAQDRAIKGAFVGTRASKAVQYGWRTGAAAGGLIGGTLINNAPDGIGNGQERFVPKTRTPYKTRRRFSTSYRTRSGKRQFFDKSRRCPRPRKRY